MIKDILNRIRLAIIVLFWGDLLNGNLDHLKRMQAELEYIRTHQVDLSKEDILKLILSSGSNTGVMHHLVHIINSLQNWRVVNAEMREAELIEYKRKIKKILGE